MCPMKTDTEIFEEMKPLIVDALAVPSEKISLKSILVRDLGAESIDLLDLSFRIEEKFKVSIEANEIEKEARKRLPGGVYEKDGFLTDEALEEIRRAVPEIDQSRLVRGLRKNQLPSLLTVSFFVKLIARKLAEKEGVAHA